MITTAPKPTYDKSHPPNPELLSLAYEPESAAIHCMDVAAQQGKSFDKSKCYMVLDIGGGTADITIYKLNASGAIEVILTPQGNDWGGTRVNAEFKKFLGKLVNDPDFNQYISTGDEESNAKNGVDLDEIMNVRFEDVKKFFGDAGPSDARASISLPYSFMEIYNNALKKGIAALGDGRVTLNRDELRITYTKMEEFFSPTIHQIQSCVMRALKKCPTIVDTVFFVGGFGGCRYFYDMLEREIKNYHNRHCATFRPLNHLLAVVSGAIKFRQNPAFVRSRIADATYGSDGSIKFNPSLHSVDYRYEDDDGNPQCAHIFVPYVESGDTIECDKLVVSVYVPGSHNQKAMYFDIYTSPRRNIKYSRKPNGNPLPDVYKIGGVRVEMPIATGDKSREVKLTFDFSHTEIQVQAYDLTSGKKAATVVNFLSDRK